MLFAAGAVGAAAVGALDLLSSLTPDKSNAAKTGVKQTNSLFDLGTTTTTTNTTTVSSTTPTQSGALSPSTLNALLSAQDSDGKTSRADALKDLFAQIDCTLGQCFEFSLFGELGWLVSHYGRSSTMNALPYYFSRDLCQLTSHQAITRTFF